MNKKNLWCIGLAFMLCSCGNISDQKKYRPTHFPTNIGKEEYKIPFHSNNNDVLVNIRLNGGTQFTGAVWDLGCSFPLKISHLEIANLMKDNTFKAGARYSEAISVTVANGQSVTMDAYVLDEVAFTDVDGKEHSVSNVPAVVDSNISTRILVGKPLMDKLGYSQEIDNNEMVIIIKE